MRAAQVGGADDGAQIVGVLHAVTQHKEGRLVFLAGDVQQRLQIGVFHLRGPGGHALMLGGAAQLLQLAGGRTLDHRPGLPGQRGVIARHGGRHGIRQQHGVHRAAAFQQLGDRVFAPHKGLFFFAGGLALLTDLFHV